MARPTISLWGATLSDAAGLEVPVSGGGKATFPWVEGSQTITANGTYDVTELEEAVVNVSGGSATVDVVTTTPSSNSTSISFDVDGEPLMFAVQWSYTSGSYMSGSSTRYITSVISDGTNCYGSSVYRSGSSGREYFYTTASFSYSNGTLTVTSPSSSTLGYFRSGYTYRLIYVY